MPVPRTLAEALRGWDVDQLTRLLRHRPDLADPPPTDVAELATRATTTASIHRALDGLDAWCQLVAEGLAALPDRSSLDELVTLLGQPAEPVAAAVSALTERALAWGDNERLHLVRPVREAYEPYPLGLAPPGPRPLAPAEIDAALAGLDDLARKVLDRLAWAPAGAVRNADRPISVDAARTPIEALLARQLLRPMDASTVLLPREVAWRWRGGRPTAEPVRAESPPVTGRVRSADLVDRAAAGAAFGLLHDVELVVYALEATPHRLLRSGGLGTRDAAGLARSLGTDLAHAGFLLECAAAARLIGPSTAGTVLPTPDFDGWLAEPAERRWRRLVTAWLDAERLFDRVAEPGGHPLGPEADHRFAPALRRTVLQLVTSSQPGTVLDVDELTAAATWHRPRLSRPPMDAVRFVAATWREAAWLGLVALDAVTSFAAAAADEQAPLPGVIAALFPEPIEQIIVQADLTAVAPGPLAPTVAADLRLLADQESRGGGGVYRFSATSLRRAYDAGWSAADITTWLERHSRTGLPQPLAYLVGDVARRHGTIRVGTAGAYVRIDDEVQAAAVLAHPRAAELGLRRVAPGVLVADADPDEVVHLLHQLSHTPAVEDARGELVTTAGRARAPRRPLPEAAPGRSPATVAAALLIGEQRVRAALDAAGGLATEDTLAQLESATRDATPVRVAYVTADGTPTERELAPLDLGAGRVRAVDRESASVITIPLARISSVVPAGTRP